MNGNQEGTRFPPKWKKFDSSSRVGEARMRTDADTRDIVGIGGEAGAATRSARTVNTVWII
jgi:hypothetical protein